MNETVTNGASQDNFRDKKINTRATTCCWYENEIVMIITVGFPPVKESVIVTIFIIHEIIPDIVEVIQATSKIHPGP